MRHAKFGDGVVLEFTGGVLTVDFETFGVKKIVAAYAPVEPLEE